MSDLTQDQLNALRIAHELVDMGVPIFSAPPHSTNEFARPDAWQNFRPNHVQVDRWKPGWALAMVTGVVFDVLDVDPRNGGEDGWQELLAAEAVPWVYGKAATPSGGDHLLIDRTHLAKTSKAARGVDLQAGQNNGDGRGYIYIAPTVRLSKYGPRKGEMTAYRWVQAPSLPADSRHAEPDPRLDNLRAVVNINRGSRRQTPPRAASDRPAPLDDDLAAFMDEATDWTARSAVIAIQEQLQAVQDARAGEINSTLGGAARMLGRFVGGGFVDQEDAAQQLLEALERGGQHSDSWNAAHGKGWTAATVIGAGLANGIAEPWTVETPAAEPATDREPARAAGARAEPDTAPVVTSADRKASPTPIVGAPRLRIESAADMAYWLQNAIGSAGLSGYFLRGGAIVHTPRVDEAGYVAPRADEDTNGPAQIQPVTAPTLAAKIQYAFHCFKEVDEKDAEGKKTGNKREVPALFPLEAAKRATDAPEAMVMLRGLAGITHTPMVRPDGSILEKPGYDPATRYLFLPGQGVNVPAVPAAPDASEIGTAVALLDEMTAGFPWESADDRANYYGMLLTPMLRLATPPSYKMFFIGAHQPGSGKTLLADVARILHGGIFRSEWPVDEKEVKSMTTSLLATTSAPVVQVDNFTGVLRSAYLAGLLTSMGEMQERELGKSSNLTFTNDRVWVFTGNNPSLGGDLVRRAITVMIDPNMANPETREFAIKDLPAWAAANRNRLLWALLVMIRAWVAAGRPLADRKQSDSFATWEASVAGILQVCGVPGAFDQQSGQRAATGGDDDGLSQVLERAYAMHGDKSWSVAEMLSDTQHTDMGDFVMESRDWLPSAVLDKLSRSEAAGRKSFGRWLLNRVGRWVSGSDGHSYVIRQAGQERNVARWKVERTP